MSSDCKTHTKKSKANSIWMIGEDMIIYFQFHNKLYSAIYSNMLNKYTTHNKLRIFGYGFKIFGELYMSCTNDFVCDHSIVLWYEMYLFGVVSFIVFAWHACKEQGGGGSK